jgi:hypothetical protein
MNGASAGMLNAQLGTRSGSYYGLNVQLRKEMRVDSHQTMACLSCFAPQPLVI